MYSSSERTARFRDRWAALGGSLRVADVAGWDATGRDLLRRHREPTRRYHTDEHVLAVLAHLDELNEGQTSPAQELAAFLHDAIYDARAADNETRSALLAQRVGDEFEIDAAVVAACVRMIEATLGHHPTDVEGCDRFLDADLAILGAPPDVYDRYARDIAAEYSHMDPLDYRTGREAVLEGFLARERLFFTTEGRDRFEVQARNNLRREIETLTS